MPKIEWSGAFKKGYKKANRRKKDLQKLHEVIALLANEEELSERLCDHKLTGSRKDQRECHIEPDWLLVYQIKEDVLFLIETGSHSDLFK